jgi:hypothetical protein
MAMRGKRDAMVERLLACMGVASVEHTDGLLGYDRAKDAIRIPTPDKCGGPDGYFAHKLSLGFLASGSEKREDRDTGVDEKGAVRDAYKRARAILGRDMFSLLGGARFGLPCPDEEGVIERLNGNENEDWEPREVNTFLNAAADAGRFISAVDQFEHGEQPRVKWFPDKSLWSGLMAMREGQNAKDCKKLGMTLPKLLKGKEREQGKEAEKATGLAM